MMGLFILGLLKLSDAFSTNRCGFGNGLYEISPEDFKYILKSL